MNAVIPDLDADAYEALQARAVLERRTVSELINDAIRAYLAPPLPRETKFARVDAGTIPAGER